MILFIHMFIGAVIATKIGFLPLVLVLAFLSHYFLDFLPHNEYSVKNIKERRWEKSTLDFSKLGLDSIIGLILILFIQDLTEINYLVLFVAAFFAILPDVLSVLTYWLFPNNKTLKYHSVFHLNYIHYFKKKKISIFWRIISQILIIFLGFAILIV